LPGGALLGTFLSDEHGNNIGNVSGNYNANGAQILIALFGIPGALTAHDMHVNIRLPTASAVSLLNGTFDMFDDGGGDFVVGVQGVPEPATFVLLGLGIASIGYQLRKKGDRPPPRS